MIKAIGFKRFVVLMILLATCGAVYFFNTSILSKQLLKSQGDLAVVQGEILNLQGELEKMKTDAEFFATRKEVYEKISNLGFFETQDRVQARQRFDAIQKLSKIVAARYKIRAASVMAKPEATENQATEGAVSPAASENFSIIESPVAITLSAIDDLDIYRFIYFLNYGFPGHITITSVNIKKESEVSPETLKDIGLGNPPTLISASIDLTWRSMIPKTTMDSSSDLKTLSTGVSQ